jgi:hypothetical protein
MKKIALVLGLALLSGAAASAASAAASAEDLKKALGLSIYLQGGYTYNADASSLGPGQGEENNLRVFDHKANSFTLDLAQIVFSKDAATGAAGYKLKLSAGETAKWIHSRGLSGAALDTAQAGEGTDAIDVTEAYVSYVAPLGKGLKFDFGKYVTYHGAEVIEAKDNANYSRGFLFNYAIPFTHTGVKVSYPVLDTLTATAHVVNGWDNSTDNNKAKSYMVNVAYAPVEAISAVVNYMTGPEKDDNNFDQRELIDIVATIKPVKNLALILNYDTASEENGAAPESEWSGIAAIVKYDFNDTYSLAVRAESFDDKDGVRTGAAQKLKEVTVTPEIRLASGLILRPEYRHDTSDVQSFDNGTKKKQDTIALGVMYAW